MKKKNKEKAETDFSSLLVFGYGCTLFRDDQRALSMEAGDHLIPWMGDNSLRIDRYDGRGHLYNLSEYEAKPASSLKADDLERHEEELCEEERWRSLYHDDSEDVLKQEEEAKRAGEAGVAGAQIGFSYEAMEAGVEYGPEVPQNLEPEDDSEAYIPGPELDLPPGVTPPATLKQFSVIERTALLIAGQGPQMEILLKTKQAGNPVFDFLSLEHDYNKFYKHLVMLVKTRQYRKRSPAPPPPPASVSLVPQYSDLAPDLAPKVTPAPQYKRSENCAYSQLITKLQKYAPAPAPAPKLPPPISDAPVADVSKSKESSPVPVIKPSPAIEMPEGPIVIPPTALQTIVDKTASYVAKNGRSFEEIVFSKDKSRFGFLKPGDKHYNYYLHKLNIYMTGNYDPSVSSEPLTFKMTKREDKSKESKVTANNPISGLLDYSSESEGEESSDPVIKSDGNSVEKENKTGFPNLAGFLPPTITSNPKLYSDPKDEERQKEDEENKRRKDEANKLRDKLAAKAREKMVEVAKEKALQLERKRKAAQFLAQLAEKKTTVSSNMAMAVDKDSSAEEGEITVAGPGAEMINETEAVEADTDNTEQAENVSAVNIWPPPAPPRLVIPTLAVPANTVVDLSSDSEEERPKKRRRRSRSRSRERRKKRRSRSRSRHKKSRRKERRRRHSSSGDRDADRRRRRHKKRRDSSSGSDSDKSSRKRRQRRRSDDDESEEDMDRREGGSERGSREASSQAIEEIVKPTVNKMTEELRAKVRAMLDNK